MAAQLWRSVLGVQAALAVALAVVFIRHAPAGSHLWLGIDVIVLDLVALQYLLGFAVIAVSRALAPPTPRPRMLDTLRAALTEPVYFGLAQLAMARRRRMPPAAARGARGPLLLVHGFACNAGVWRWLAPRLRAAGFGPIRAVELAPFGVDVDTLARTLAGQLRDFHASSGMPVTVLAHSLGGLASRAALNELDPRVVRRLVTIGSPHHGAGLARLWHAPPVVQMRPDSRWLAALNARPVPLSVPITSIYSVDDNLVTPWTSAELPGARAHVLHGLGHFGLLVSSRGADCVLRALQEEP